MLAPRHKRSPDSSGLFVLMKDRVGHQEAQNNPAPRLFPLVSYALAAFLEAVYVW
jgi:hypothetical protein